MRTKSSLGIPYGVLAAVMYIVCLYSGALGTLLVAGYVLLKEKEEWIRTQAVKVVLLMLVFGVFSILLDLIPDAISVVSRLFEIFGGSLSIPFVSDVLNFVDSLLGFIKTLVFLGLAYKSLSFSTIRIPFVDSIISKVASGEATEIDDLTNDMAKDFNDIKEKASKAKDAVVEAVQEAMPEKTENKSSVQADTANTTAPNDFTASES